MAEERSLGELAFLAYQQRCHSVVAGVDIGYVRPFRLQADTVRAAWEAAAEAVRAAVLQLTRARANRWKH